MTWLVHVAASARKNLKRFPRPDQERVISALNEMGLNPYSGDVQKLGGDANTWRRRVGNYRLIYDVNANRGLVEIRIIKRRVSNTY